MENGVLSVTVPKAEVKKPDVKTIEISGFPIPSSSPFSTFPVLSWENSVFLNTRIDCKETTAAHVFKADRGGEGGARERHGASDHGEREGGQERQVQRLECSSGKFFRRFQLPENAKVDEIKAAMENGVLSVTVPKAGAKKPDAKAIEISG
ncbi:Alpha crystallin/Hsp20 domain-containing protein [Prunus yedoensis var. nudiflora]|uniref:Alpha crystallin/Hsp20 domain-containing protein n=1 Tax=Prunus yedoensis var. nudiflora TaxID=2094558 RepID=A0A314U6R3_PRUYE|nr:Alpha crystallin/Hsp20 domain-containing protein [Prunus yedoensis var. nudiflora]